MTQTFVFACLVAMGIVTLAPVASASHTVFYSCGTQGDVACKYQHDTCSFLTIETCSVWIQNHLIQGIPDADCAGSQGSFSSCRIYHLCLGGGSGVLAVFVIHCTGVGQDAFGGGTGVWRDEGAEGSVTIDSGQCKDLSMVVSGRSALAPFDEAQASDSLRVCVDGSGPYVPS